jgi:hypothetical protein
MQWPNPSQSARSPSHAFWPRSLIDCSRHYLHKQFPRGFSVSFDYRKPDLTLSVVALLALIERGQAGALEEALDRLLRRANARPFLLDRLIRLFVRQPVDDQREPARRDERIGARKFETLFIQLVADDSL